MLCCDLRIANSTLGLFPQKRSTLISRRRSRGDREEEENQILHKPPSLCLSLSLRMTMEDSSSDDRVIKAPTDRRLYRLLRLPNGLSSLLVHDPEVLVDGVQESSSKGKKDENDLEDEADGEEDEDDEEDEDEEEDDDEDDEEESEEGDEDEDEDEKEEPLTKKAAAALCVGIGSFSDPFEAQGLAHFLEHMLFMGSSEFPDENEYDSYLSKHGGSSNAYTETEYTCYHFEVNREYLKGALKRFSQFFISPLIKAEAMEREILAVDSEFNQVIQNDGVRLQQLQCHTSYPGHPFNRFFWGNKKSLSEAMERGINLREQILRLYRENYHCGLMKLVVIGGEPLDTLEDWVIELFGSVKEGLHLKVDPQKNIPIWETGKIYRVEAVKDVNVLHLLWTLPPLDKEYLKKPEDYVAHLLGHEGSGSLLFFFKAKGWASSLSAGVGDEGTRKCAVAYIFDMSIHLTESGLEQVNEVVGVVYQYLKLLRQVGPQAWVFKELQDIGNLEFRFAEEQVQDDYAVELAENMLFYSEEHVIYGQYAFQIWDPKLVEHVLSFFTPNNMRIDLLSKSFNKESKDIQYEPWFGSPYIVEDIAVSLLEIWTDPPEVDPSLHLPSKNEFLPCDFSIRIANPSEIPPNAATNLDLPICLVDEPMMKLWYKPDSIFKVPRANTYFLITVKEGYKDVKNCVLTELFVSLLKDELNEILYQAGLAKLDTSLSIIGDKIELRLYGFNDKLQALLIRILNISKLFSPTADRFKVIKEDMERSYRNFNMKPLSHSSYLRLQVLRLKFWDVDEKLACLTNLSLPDLKSSIPELLSQLHIEGLCHGNISVEEVLDISNIFKNTFSVRTLPVEIRHHENILCMPSGSIIMNASVKNKMEVNSVAELYFQIEQDVGVEAARMRAVSDLFDKIVEEPFFNQLRTKEQLGYAVESGPRMTYRVLGFCFIVQSAEYDPIYLHGRIDHFICGLQQLLDNLDDESFENYRTGLIEEKLEKDPSLIHETNHYWNQIVDKRYVFDMLKKEAEELKSIQKSDIITFYNTYLRLGSPKCRILAIHMWGCKTNMKGEGETQKAFGTIIEDLTAFKGSTLFYPSLC